MYLANKNIPEALILKIEYYPCFKPGVNASQGEFPKKIIWAAYGN